MCLTKTFANFIGKAKFATMRPNPQHLVEQLTRFRQRATGHKTREAVFQTLADHIEDEEVEIQRQSFRTPYHYIQLLYWLFVGLILALLLAELFPLLAIGLSMGLFWLGFRYFDWRSSLLSKLPPLRDCFNFIARKQAKNARIKIVLMAHWDTAPIAIPYRPEMIKGLKSSIFVGQGVMLLCVLVCAIPLWQKGTLFFSIAQFVLIAYWLIQLLIVSIDFWRFGYSNGANDNATGCAAALMLAHELWGKDEPSCEVEICITGAEEVGMLGAQHYYQQSIKNTSLLHLIINFDTIGCEQLQIITESGTFSKISYDHELLAIARKLSKERNIAANFGRYNTADVDTACFVRAGIPSLSFISHNSAGIPAYIHRPEDTMDKIHWSTLEQAIDLAGAICDYLIKQHTPYVSS